MLVEHIIFVLHNFCHVSGDIILLSIRPSVRQTITSSMTVRLGLLVVLVDGFFISVIELANFFML